MMPPGEVSSALISEPRSLLAGWPPAPTILCGLKAAPAPFLTPTNFLWH